MQIFSKMWYHGVGGAALLVSGLLGGCGAPDGSQQAVPATTSVQAPAQSIAPEESSEFSTLLSQAPTGFGDFAQMRERGFVRVVTSFNRSFYFLDEGQPRGVMAEALTAFEQQLNSDLAPGEAPIKVLVFPVPRDEILPALLAGRADLAAANLTITEARSKLVDFSTPAAVGIREVVVTRGDEHRLSEIQDLATVPIYVRRSSSYRETLAALSGELNRVGQPEIEVRDLDERLEAGDILELISVGNLSATVVDDYLARQWSRVFPELHVHEQLSLGGDKSIAWAFRKDSPEFKRVVDDFVSTHRKGTLFGNVVIEKYLRSDRWLEVGMEPLDQQKFVRFQPLFEKYAQQYGTDWLLSAAQGYQESRLTMSAVSDRGAVGVMQLLPSTATDPHVAIANIDTPEGNIHAGIKYLAFLRDRYFSSEQVTELNQLLFSLGAYNAGPARIRRARAQAVAAGLDPDTWFQSVEFFAPKETAKYVGNIFKYYVAYREYFTYAEAVGDAREDVQSI